MEKATIPGALAEALQKRHEIMVVTVSRTLDGEEPLGVPASAKGSLPRSHCVAARHRVLSCLQPSGAGLLTGSREGEQQILRQAAALGLDGRSHDDFADVD
jgi:hypothetical protein